ncbi:MAG: glycosyltransferase family 39 protein [Candidatus Eisenbacteria bacterium]|nr:glycosyltransferase family 39 protein [Candidatus Eisenbacteria bacterium]
MRNLDSNLTAPCEEKSPHWGYIAAALLLALLLRLYRISSQSIWVDEMLTLHASGITFPLHLIDIFDNVHGALHSVVLFLWTRIAGTSEFALRLPSAVFSVLSIFAIYRLLLKLVGRETALVALTILVISPFHIWYGQEVRNYSMLIFFSTLSVDSFLSLLQEPGKGTFAKYVLFTFAAFLSNMSTTFLLIVENILFFLLPRKLSFRNLVFANVFIALLLIPWIWGMIGRVEFHRLVRTAPYLESEMLRGETTFTPLAIPYTFYNFSIGYTLGPSLRELHESVGFSAFRHYLPVLLAAALGFSVASVAGIVSLRKRRRLLLALLLWILVPAVFVSFFAIKNFKPFNPRYVMVAFPAYLALVAEGVRRIKPLFIRPILAVLIAATMGLSLWNYYQVPRHGKEDFRSAANKLKADFHPDDIVFAEGTFEPLIYYCGSGFPLSPIYPEVMSDQKRLMGLIEERTAGKKRIWLVTSRLWTCDPDRRIETLFRELFVLKEESFFEGIQLFLFEKKLLVAEAT